MSRKPVVFIPGFPGCTLHDGTRTIFPPSTSDLIHMLTGNRDRLPVELQGLKGPEDTSVPDGVTAREVIRAVGQIAGIDYGKQAATLYENARALGYEIGTDFLPVAWDWRLPVHHSDTQDRVSEAIRTTWNRFNEPVSVIVHSTGGLVFRSFLEDARPENRTAINRIGQLIALGVPWAGTLKSLRFVIGRSAFAGGIISRKQAAEIIGHSWAAFDLMPADPTQTDMTDFDGPLSLFLDENGTPVSPLVDRRWIPDGMPHQVLRALDTHNRLGHRTQSLQYPPGVAFPVTNIVGWGALTETQCRIVIKPEGPTLSFSSSRDGDQTIPRRSAAWLRGPEVTTFHIPAGIFPESSGAVFHGQLWDSAPARAILASKLTDASAAPYVFAAFDEDEFEKLHTRIRVNVMGLDAAGKPLVDARASFRPDSRQRTNKVGLDRLGRSVLRYQPDLSPFKGNGGYPCPVVVEWRENGTTRRRELDLGFVVA